MESVAPESPKKRKRIDHRKTHRIGPEAHARMLVFSAALERLDFAKTRKLRRVSVSDAIERLLDQPWANEIMREWEEAQEKNRFRL